MKPGAGRLRARFRPPPPGSRGRPLVPRHLTWLRVLRKQSVQVLLHSCHLPYLNLCNVAWQRNKLLFLYGKCLYVQVPVIVKPFEASRLSLGNANNSLLECPKNDDCLLRFTVLSLLASLTNSLPKRFWIGQALVHPILETEGYFSGFGRMSALHAKPKSEAVFRTCFPVR